MHVSFGTVSYWSFDDNWILFVEGQMAKPNAQDEMGALAISPTIVSNSTHTHVLP
jgi:hypothetical protein